MAGPGSSEVDPNADERSLESSSGKTLSVERPSSLGISVSSVDPRGSLQACLFDKSSRSALCRGLYSSRCEPPF